LADITPAIVENAFDKLPLVSCLTGKLSTVMYGGQDMQGAGRKSFVGESIEIRMNLGKNTSTKALAGPFDTVDTTPSDTPRMSRAIPKIYTATIVLAGRELRANRGEARIVSLLENETKVAISSVVDFLGGHCYDNGGVGQNVTGLEQIIDAGSILQGLSGTTYIVFNSRGLSARNTAPGSVSFTGGSFATTGLQNMRICWNNAWEGSEKPEAIFTTHLIYGYYEGSLQPLERFTDERVADGGFEVLKFKSAPVFPDPQCPSGNMYDVNFGHLYLAVDDEANFAASGFIEMPQQDVRVAKIIVDVQLCCDSRKLQNKTTSITA
jgi:hypothetical protein